MRLLFKQRMFSWFDSYDIYDENENTVYVVKGQFAWGHCLKIFDASGCEGGFSGVGLYDHRCLWQECGFRFQGDLPSD